MKTSLRGLVVFILLFAAGALWASEPIRIGVLAYPLKPWQPLAAELKRQIPERDFIIEVLDHGALEQAVASRRVDFVLTNPGHYLLMKRRSGLSSPLVTLMNNDRGHKLTVYGGAIIVRADRSDIRALRDIRGKTVAFVDLSAQGGYQAQAYELALRGIDPQRDVQLLKLGGPHEKLVEAVLGRKADVGFVRAGLLEELVESGKLDSASLRVLNRQDLADFPWQVSTHLYPEWPLASLPHIDEFIARRVTAVLMQLDRDPELVRAMEIAGFTVPADYLPVEDMLWTLRLPPFDNGLRFTFSDVWEKYRWQIAGALLLLGMVLLLSILLMIANRRLRMDVAARRQAEMALARSNAELEQFAYSVSHDMRQPLRMVSGHLQLLEKGLGDTLDNDLRECLHFALDGAKRMDSMIVSLLDYSRVGRKTEAKSWQSSRATLDEALGFLEPLVRDTSAVVEVSGVWPQVYASRDELTRLFQNLVGNGIKFCEPGQAPRVEVGSSVEGDRWRVTVRDHGIGIDPSQSDRLFQFFSRLQSRARYDGTGMGLALCRRIVEHHGGRIWAESGGEGRGSMFVFELPLGTENAEPSGS